MLYTFIFLNKSIGNLGLGFNTCKLHKVTLICIFLSVWRTYSRVCEHGEKYRHRGTGGDVPIRSLSRRHHHCFDQHANCNDESLIRGHPGIHRFLPHLFA